MMHILKSKFIIKRKNLFQMCLIFLTGVKKMQAKSKDQGLSMGYLIE